MNLWARRATTTDRPSGLCLAQRHLGSELEPRPILDGLRQVHRLERVAAGQVGDGERQL